MSDYVEKVSYILENELRQNTEFVKDWVGYPHSHSTSPKRNTMQLDQLQYPIFYPDVKAYHTNEVKTAV